MLKFFFSKNSGSKYIAVVAYIVMATAMMVSCHAKSNGRRYIFVDGGAYKGDSLLAFRTTKLYKKYPWEIFAIEANPYLIASLKEIPNITIISKAMWHEDGTTQFYVRSIDDREEDNAGRGSTVYGNPFAEENIITVETFDFGKWLQQNFSTDDFIIVSMDIEGSEYEILDKMLRDETIHYVDRFYIEFHAEDYHEFREKEEELIEKLNNVGILKGHESVDYMVNHSKPGWMDTLEEQ